MSQPLPFSSVLITAEQFPSFVEKPVRKNHFGKTIKNSDGARRDCSFAARCTSAPDLAQARDGRAAVGKSLPTPQAVPFLNLATSLGYPRWPQVESKGYSRSNYPKFGVPIAPSSHARPSPGDSRDSCGWAITIELCQYTRERDQRLKFPATRGI